MTSSQGCIVCGWPQSIHEREVAARLIAPHSFSAKAEGPWCPNGGKGEVPHRRGTLPRCPACATPAKAEGLRTLADLRGFLVEHLPDGQGAILHLFDDAVRSHAMAMRTPAKAEGLSSPDWAWVLHDIGLNCQPDLTGDCLPGHRDDAERLVARRNQEADTPAKAEGLRPEWIIERLRQEIQGMGEVARTRDDGFRAAVGFAAAAIGGVIADLTATEGEDR